MNSFNNIERFKYTKNQADVVSLSEYIVFEDERAKEKYAVLKLTNNLNQNLYEVQLEISQYDRKDNLVEKVVVSYDNFKAKANETFVPNAKVKLNYLCKTISVRLVFARFERVKFEQNELVDLNRVFKDYKATLETTKEIVVKKTIIENPIKKTKRRFSLKDTTKKNKVKFPTVFNVIISIILCVVTSVTAYNYTKNNVNRFSVANYDFEYISDNYAAIIGYDGFEKNLTIPTHIGDREIIKIDEYAFKNSKIESITIYNPKITIDNFAFYRCKKLTSVTIKSEASLLEYAFFDCPAIENISMMSATLTTNAFAGSYNVKNLEYGKCSLNHLIDAFYVQDERVLVFDTIKTKQFELRHEFLDRIVVNYAIYVNESCYVEPTVYEEFNVVRTII